ncbi:hypothetical protein R69746_08612 [Paraburkholderia aspalathi]|nr:hypothetical protein R69746_08612 [Paraburkholderia aspalathi]
MAATDRITMTMCELDRFKVIQAVADDLQCIHRNCYKNSTEIVQKCLRRLF